MFVVEVHEERKIKSMCFLFFFLHIFFPWHKIKVLDKHTTKLVVQRHQYTSNCFRIFRRGAIFIVMKVKKLKHLFVGLKFLDYDFLQLWVTESM